MTYVETRMNIWEALAGRPPGEPIGPADPGLWAAIVDRLNPARARPVLRAGVEAVELASVRGPAYIMVRSPDDGSRACYLRLTPEEWELAQILDGSLSVARLVAEFARIAGRLAPDQVKRVVADLAGNRMLEELPLDAFRPLEAVVRKPLPVRVGRGLLNAARGRRLLITDIDGFVSGLYRFGARFLFTKVAAVVLGLIALTGLGIFGWTWVSGTEALFLTNGSYLLGAVILLLLNVVALACHELGHALATKHAGREVPAAGLLVYFGIPSVFVDTTDVWMAGRRARLLVTAVGPLTGLVLAGGMQTVGLFVPAVAGLAFKLAFAWYVNVLFNLNPFIALDGYYLLMDWLEIPNLRTRGLSWVSSRLRGRPPRWSTLDREGRIIALYGVLAVLWLAVAANLAYRMWSDRVSGVATGLWHSGPAAQLLLVLIVLGLCAPLVHLGLRRLSRWWRKSRARAAEKQREADLPRRIEALRNSDLGGLPEHALHGLAARARWERPAPGRQIVLAGGPQTAVYVVVDGALQGRRPGDPGGTIRHHVGPGGVVGLGNALTGRATALDWHTAGTTLLSVPTATVATVIGPLPGPPPLDRDEAETLFADTPALAALAGDEQLALIASAHPVDLEPGAPVMLVSPTQAVVVESGVIAMADGTELRRGTLVGPVGDGSPGMVAQSRTPVRLWVMPDASSLPPLVGGNGVTAAPVVEGRGAPRFGKNPDDYPPLIVPPGPPDGTEDPEVDKRFLRRMWWLVLLVLLLALLLTAANIAPGPAWAEMPANRAVLTSERGRLTVKDGERVTVLAQGDRRFVTAGATIEVADNSSALLTFSGGSAALLCGGSTTEVGALATGTGRGRQPSGELTLDSGRLLADTTSTSGAYRPLDLRVNRPLGAVTSTGKAWYSIDTAAVTVSAGRVEVDGQRAAPTNRALSCGDGVAVEPPAAGPSSEPPSELPSEPSATPSVEESSAPPPTEEPDPIPRPNGNPRNNNDNDNPPATNPRPTTPRPRPTTTTPPSQPDPPDEPDPEPDPDPTSDQPDPPDNPTPSGSGRGPVVGMGPTGAAAVPIIVIPDIA
ncbi:cyclic nucleotide-binding protein [Actinoplanes sp. NPDC049265]|uniref:cyclic nucleotide-binding protein n=1 Tax=Actinoplanes sp. NPDC049265 TaxID=3363902 RepID=UPI003718D966